MRLLASAALLISVACGNPRPSSPPPPPPSGCISTLECNPGEQCVGGACRQVAAGFAEPCNMGMCNPGLRCNTTTDRCVQCLVIDDCPLGFHCGAFGLCDAGSGGGDARRMGDARLPPGDLNSAAGDANVAGGDTSGGGGTLTELERCMNDNQCVPALACREMQKGGIQRCLSACATSATCPMGTRCLPEAPGNRCLGDDLGRACAAPNDCNFGCLLPQGYCSAPCTSGADCPVGFGCQAVGMPAQNLCVRVEAICDAMDTSACIAMAACDTSANLIVSGCTIACNSAADCPQRAAGLAPWTCDGLCRRPGDVYGPQPPELIPAQWACDGASQPVNVCHDAQHVDWTTFTIPPPPMVNCMSPNTTDGIGEDYCTDTCRYGGGCSFGYSCVGIGSIAANRIGLCAPAGAALTGTPCTSHTNCEFGYCYMGNCSRDCTRDGLCTGGTNCVAGGPPTIEGLAFRRCQ